MRRTMFALVVGLCVALAACTGGTATSAPSQAASSSAPSTPPSVAVSIAPSAPPAASELPSAAPTTIDPCVLIPASLASQLAGTTYTTGDPKTTSGGGKFCDYGDGTTNVFHVVVTQAADQKTADAAKADAQAEIIKAAQKGVKFIEVPSIGDGCAYIVGTATYLGAKVNASAIYCLKGLIFFGFSDLALGSPTPTADLLQSTATNLLPQLP